MDGYFHEMVKGANTIFADIVHDKFNEQDDDCIVSGTQRNEFAKKLGTVAALAGILGMAEISGKLEGPTLNVEVAYDQAIKDMIDFFIKEVAKQCQDS